MSVCEVKHNFETNLNIANNTHPTDNKWPTVMSAGSVADVANDDESNAGSDTEASLEVKYALHCAVFNNDLKRISQLLRNYDIQLKDIHGMGSAPGHDLTTRSPDPSLPLS